MPDTTLDLRGLRCPLPALKTRKALTRLAAGDRLVVECTDPLSTLDIPNLINQTGDVLEDSEDQPGLFVFRIKKGRHDPESVPLRDLSNQRDTNDHTAARSSTTTRTSPPSSPTGRSPTSR